MKNKKIFVGLVATMITTVTMAVGLLKTKSVQAWGLAQHITLTKEGIGQFQSLSKNSNFLDQQKINSILAGSVMNDVYNRFDLSANFNSNSNHVYCLDDKFRLARFGINYGIKNNAFINQSHHGDLQFLHAMTKASSETQEEAANKMNCWAGICLEMLDPNSNLINTKIIDFVEKGNPIYKDMFARLLINPKYDDQKLTARELFEKIENKANQTKFYKNRFFSSFAEMTFGQFFQLENNNLNPRYVALGSLMHMIEDSFAGSHALRVFSSSDNPALTKLKAALIENKISHSSENLTEMLSSPCFLNPQEWSSWCSNWQKIIHPVTIFADYKEQDGHKHGFGDSFYHDKHHGKFDANGDILATKGASESIACITKVLYDLEKNQNKDTVRFLNNFVFNLKKDNNEKTLSGRQYSNLSNWKKLANGNKYLSNTIDCYEKSLEKYECDNTAYTLSKKLSQLNQQFNYLKSIHDYLKNTELNKEIIAHINEMLATLKDPIFINCMIDTHNKNKENKNSNTEENSDYQLFQDTLSGLSNLKNEINY